MALSTWVVMTPAIMWFLVVVLAGSAVAGYIYWYGNSILAAPWYLWLFVPDSPLSVTLMAAALVAFHFGHHWDLLGLVAAGTCIKYGIWTDFVWFTDYLSGGDYHSAAILMSATHFGMVILGLIIAVFLRFRLVAVAVTSLFLIVNDIVDYVLGYHPNLPNPEDVPAIWRFSVATTAVLVAWFVIMAWVARRPAGRRALVCGEAKGQR